MTATNGAAWRSILSDPNVARWHAEFGSERTADERVRILYRYCRIHRTKPTEIARIARRGEAGREKVRNQFFDFAKLLQRPHKPSDHSEDNSEERRAALCAGGHKRSYAENYKKALGSWLESVRAPVGKLSLGRRQGGTNGNGNGVENEMVPTREDLPNILAAGTDRARVAISYTALASLRLEVLGMKRDDGQMDGLVLGDLPDVEILPGTRDHPRGVVHIRKYPARVHVRAEISKVRLAYDTFLIREGCDYLVAYLQNRLDRGEDLGPASPVVRPEPGFERKGRPDAIRGSPFLTTQAVAGDIREALRAAGHTCRPAAMRKYGAGQLQSAVREGKLDALDREFFLGRNSAITLVYTHFHQLPAEKVEELRRAFAKAELFLATREAKPETPPEEIAARLMEEFDAKLKEYHSSESTLFSESVMNRAAGKDRGMFQQIAEKNIKQREARESEIGVHKRELETRLKMLERTLRQQSDYLKQVRSELDSL